MNDITGNYCKQKGVWSKIARNSRRKKRKMPNKANPDPEKDLPQMQHLWQDQPSRREMLAGGRRAP